MVKKAPLEIDKRGSLTGGVRGERCPADVSAMKEHPESKGTGL
jgi:hypothetical protein